jgi:hypothetical protein
MMYLNVTIGKRKSINRKKFSERSLSPGRGEITQKEKLNPDLARRQSESGGGIVIKSEKGKNSSTNKEVNPSLNKGRSGSG